MLQLNIGTKLKLIQTIKHIIIPILLGIFIFIMVFSLGFWGYVGAFSGKVYPGVSVAGYNVGGLTNSEAKKTIDKKIAKLESVGVSFTIQDTKSTILSYKELGISFDKESTLKNVFEIGRTKNSLNRLKEIIEALFYGNKIDLSIKIDQDKFNNKVNDLAKDKTIQAKNAAFRVVNGELGIVKDEFGIEIDLESMLMAIKELVNLENIYQSINLQTRKIQPKISLVEITSLKSDVESYLAKNISIIWQNYKFKPSKGEVVNWLIFEKESKNSQVKIMVSDEAIKNYIDQEIAKQIDKLAIDRQVDAETNEVISEGQDGRVVNEDKLLEEIKNSLSSTNKEIVITLEMLVKERGETKIKSKTIVSEEGTPGMAEGKYIEVNLSTQKLYLFEGKNQLAAYTVSTGKWDTPTPTGTRYIDGKTNRAWSNKYGLYMPYWMSLGGGYGIHELPEWPNGYKEGESHLGTPVSHGCIRLGVGSAEFVYNWVAVGTSVFIHK